VLPEGSSQELQDKFNALLAPLLLNSALAAVRAQPPSTANSLIAISSATRALDTLTLSNADKGTIRLPTSTLRKRLSPFLAKALYRRALAHIQVKDDEKAEQDLTEASKLVPDDAAIQSELSKIAQKRKEKRDKEKKQFKKMFA